MPGPVFNFVNKLAQRYWTNIMANLMEKDRYSVKSQCFINDAFVQVHIFFCYVSLAAKLHGSIVFIPLALSLFNSSSDPCFRSYCLPNAIVHFNLQMLSFPYFLYLSVAYHSIPFTDLVPLDKMAIGNSWWHWLHKIGINT